MIEVATTTTVIGLDVAGTTLLSSWKEAEQFVRDTYNGIAQCFNTAYGNRFVDSYYITDTGMRIIQEVKYGYQGLSSRIIAEIEKDYWLLSNGYVDSVEWHFFLSGISDSIGPSHSLYDALEELGFKIIFH